MTNEPARKLAWEALSELFLDTELDERAIAIIASRLGASGLGIAELERIYEEEVAPVCWRNLTVVAGVWAGFDQEWLAQEIARRLDAPRWWGSIGWLKRLEARYRTSVSRPDWDRVKARLVQ